MPWIANGVISCDGGGSGIARPGTTARIQCHEGYTLRGHESVACGNTGSWEGSFGSCNFQPGIPSTRPQLNMPVYLNLQQPILPSKPELNLPFIVKPEATTPKIIAVPKPQVVSSKYYLVDWLDPFLLVPSSHGTQRNCYMQLTEPIES